MEDIKFTNSDYPGVGELVYWDMLLVDVDYRCYLLFCSCHHFALFEAGETGKNYDESVDLGRKGGLDKQSNCFADLFG